MTLKKNEHQIAKGIGIFLMILFHLFACVSYPQFHYYTSFTRIPEYLGHLGGCCVAVFVFLTGYAFTIKDNLTYKEIINKTFRLWLISLIICIFFLPASILWGDTVLDTKKILSTVLCLPTGYNKMYWYLSFYPFVLITTKCLLDYVHNNQFLIVTFILSVISSMFFKIYGININNGILHHYISNYVQLLPFLILSILYAKYKVIIKLPNLHPIKVLFLVLFIFFINSFLFKNEHYLLYQMAQIIYLPLLILYTSNIKSRIFVSIFRYLGNLSMYIWLIHGFLFYYFAKSVYILKYWILILITFVIVNIIFSYIVNKIISKLKINKFNII